mmetsp:Transcript_12389/g.45166  ORF Transcript_12389/g.45166 Transcript_12389/m.45166 type:complete len:96 (+) Transcript_12389:58-345(+)
MASAGTQTALGRHVGAVATAGSAASLSTATGTPHTAKFLYRLQGVLKEQCLGEARAYGQCVAGHFPNVERSSCEEHFNQLKLCFAKHRPSPSAPR